MLGAVVISFFICLLPFRAFTLYIIIMPSESILKLGLDGYYALLYFCRVMLYLNSAMNPILYNLMSSKFREGFLRLLGFRGVVRGKLMVGARKGTFHTTSTNLSSSHSGDKRRSGRIKEDSDILAASFIIRACSEDVLMLGIDNKSEIRPDGCSTSSTTSSSDCVRSKMNGFAKRKRSTFDDIEELEEEWGDSYRRNGGIDNGNGNGNDDIGNANNNGSPLQRWVAGNKKRHDRDVIFRHQNGKDADQRNSSTANDVMVDATVSLTTATTMIPSAKAAAAATVAAVATPPPSIITSNMRRKAFGRKKTVSIDSNDSVIQYDDNDVVAIDVMDKQQQQHHDRRRRKSSLTMVTSSAATPPPPPLPPTTTTTTAITAAQQPPPLPPINGIRVQYGGDDNEAKTFLHNRIGRESFV